MRLIGLVLLHLLPIDSPLALGACLLQVAVVMVRAFIANALAAPALREVAQVVGIRALNLGRLDARHRGRVGGSHALSLLLLRRHLFMLRGQVVDLLGLPVRLSFLWGVFSNRAEGSLIASDFVDHFAEQLMDLLVSELLVVRILRRHVALFLPLLLLGRMVSNELAHLLLHLLHLLAAELEV